jgi:hypothetical protein
LTELSVSTILACSTANIVVGYVDDSEKTKFPKSERISFLRLEIPAITDSRQGESDYKSFEDDDFFELVQLKWVLFEKAITDIDASFFTYVDLDVVWLRDLVPSFESVFKSNQDLDALVQDATRDPSTPSLCMGVFAFRKSKRSWDLIQSAKTIHKESNQRYGRFGDDDAITQIFVEEKSQFLVLPLPQLMYPVGLMANLWSPLSIVRGLRPPTPFVFHANYVSKLWKKLLIMSYFKQAVRDGGRPFFVWIVTWLKQALHYLKP